MTDLEAELREAMRATVADARPPRDVMELFHRRRRRRNARLAAMSAAAAAVVVAAVPTSVALLGGSGRPAPGGPAPHSSPLASPTQTSSARVSPSPPPPPPGWVRHGDGQGDFIDTPAAWHVNGSSTLPYALWAIGTGPVPAGRGCGPTAALRDLPADGVLMVVMEYGSAAGEPYESPPRAGRLGLGPLGGPSECWGVKTHVVLFEDGGHYFQVQAVFGSRAPASLHAKVTRSLNTLHIVPLAASEQPAALCHAGQWTYCPQAAWVYQVINKAGVFHLGPQGTQAILGLADKRSFSLWTTPPHTRLRRGRCHAISGVNVCRDGNRLVWPVHGLLLWLRPAAFAHTKPGLPSGTALARLIQAAQSTPVR